jgi:hypothetical protein
MEHQAMKTMAAIEGVGHAQDKAAANSNSAGRKFEESARHMKNMESSAQRAGRGLDDMERKSRRTGSTIDRLGQKLGSVNQIFKFFGAIIGGMKIVGLVAGFVALAQGIAQVAGGLTALLPGLGQASMGIAALPQTIMAAVQGFGVFKAALSGVSDALKAGMQLQQQHTQVTQDFADQHIQAVHAVQQAEYGLMTSQRDVRNAQVQLTEARREAIRNLQDLRLAAIGADISQQRSVLSLREAQQALADAAVNPQTTDLQMQGLNLDVADAHLQIRQAALQQQRAHQDLHREQKRGVNGNLQVVAATQALTDAVHQQKEAVFQLSEAQRALTRLQQRGTGIQSTFRQAMANLSPPARAFVNQLLAMRPAIKGIQAAAAGGLFPGLGRAVAQLRVAFPMLRRLGARTGNVMGNEIDSMTQRFTTPGRLRDIEGLGNMNTRIIGRMIRGFSNLSAGLLDFMVAAKPFTNWLTRTLELGTQHLAVWSRNRRESGAWAAQLERTKYRLEQFWRILKDLGATLMNVFRAATPLGNRLWVGIGQGAKNMRDWTSSAEGMSKMRDWFNKLYTPLHALGQLTKDLFVAWAHIAVAPGFTQTINNLDKGVKPLEELFTSASSTGPNVANTLVAMLKFFNDLPVSSLKIALDMVTGIFKFLDLIIKNVPGAKYALSGLLLAAMMSKAIGLVKKLGTAWGDIFSMWRRAPMPPPCGCDPLGGPGGMPSPGTGAAGGAATGAARGARGARSWFGRAERLGRNPETGAFELLPAETGRFALMGRGIANFARGGGSALRALPTAIRGGRFGMAAYGASLRAMLRGGGAGGGRIAQLIEGGGFAGRSLGMLSRAGRFVGRFALPLAGLSIASGGLEGASRWGNANGATFGATRALEDITTFGLGTGGISNFFDPGADKQTRSGNEQAALSAMAKSIGRTRGSKAQMALLNQYINGIMRGGDLGGTPGSELDMGQGKERSKHLHNIVTALRQLRGNFVNRDMATADEAIGKLRDSYAIYESHGMGQRGASVVVGDFQKNFRNASMAGKRELSNGVAQWIGELKHGNAQQRALGKQLEDQVKGQWDRIGNHIQIVNGVILYGSQKEWNQISQALQDPVEKAREAVTKGFTAMQKEAVGSLQAMGFTHSEAAAIVRGQEKGGKALTKAFAGGLAGSSARTASGVANMINPSGKKKKAMGGRIDGIGLRDTVPVAPGNMAAPGELIVNRHTEARLNRMLSPFGTNVGREVAGEQTPHWMEAYGKYAKGGRVKGMGAVSGVHWDGHPALSGGIAQAVSAIEGKFPGLVVTATTDGTHVSGSDHYKGWAADMSGASGTMYSASQWIKSSGMASQLKQGIHNPNLSINAGASVSPSFWGAGTWAGHANHIHLAIAGALGALHGGNVGAGLGMGSVDLSKALINAPNLNARGAPGNMAQAALNMFQIGINANIEKAQNAMNAGAGGGLGNLSGFTGGGSSRQNQILGHKMMLAAGWGENQWPALRSLWTQESNWLPETNPSSGAYGIPQALGHGHPFDINDIPAQIRWGLNYIKGRYGSPSAAWAHEQSHNWYSHGGRVPAWGGWHADGGQFTVHRPTLVGVGDGGKETVTVSRPGDGTGRTPVHVTIHKIENHREGDIKKHVQKEIEGLVDDLDLVGAEG